ncbi:MAG: hypothetical protein HY817_03300 [Candidatus Abawacabacteria bacterium]|nr:hypothetical protein [Candidatus Abawacabacteria bacterium]
MIKKGPEEIEGKVPRRGEDNVSATREALALSLSPLERYQEQYNQAIHLWQTLGIDITSIPPWEHIAAQVTPEILARTKDFRASRLILIPPISRDAMIQALVKKFGAALAPYMHNFSDNNLWNNGREEELVWQGMIVETGKIPFDHKKQHKKSSDTQVIGLLKKYQAMGLSTVSSVRAALSIRLLDLLSDLPLDTLTLVVLNAEQVEKNPAIPLAGMFCEGKKLTFAPADRGEKATDIRLIPAIELAI